MDKFKLHNRRYVGSKYKISDEVLDLINQNCTGEIFFDVFAGTGVMSTKMMPYVEKLIINDFLYSNEVIYNAFFNSNIVDMNKIEKIALKLETITSKNSDDENYCSINFGGKYFSNNDAFKIGEIRETLDVMYSTKQINKQEFYVLLASLIYSMDKIANTVGHYD